MEALGNCVPNIWTSGKKAGDGRVTTANVRSMCWVRIDYRLTRPFVRDGKVPRREPPWIFFIGPWIYGSVAGRRIWDDMQSASFFSLWNIKRGT